MSDRKQNGADKAVCPHRHTAKPSILQRLLASVFDGLLDLLEKISNPLGHFRFLIDKLDGVFLSCQSALEIAFDRGARMVNGRRIAGASVVV